LAKAVVPYETADPVLPGFIPRSKVVVFVDEPAYLLTKRRQREVPVPPIFAWSAHTPEPAPVDET
jgi:hypothetical protein